MTPADTIILIQEHLKIFDLSNDTLSDFEGIKETPIYANVSDLLELDPIKRFSIFAGRIKLRGIIVAGYLIAADQLSRLSAIGNSQDNPWEVPNLFWTNSKEFIKSIAGSDEDLADIPEAIELKNQRQQSVWVKFLT